MNEITYIMRTIAATNRGRYLIGENEISANEYQDIKAILTRENLKTYSFDNKEYFERLDGDDKIITVFEIGTLPAYYPAWIE